MLYTIEFHRQGYKVYSLPYSGHIETAKKKAKDDAHVHRADLVKVRNMDMGGREEWSEVVA